MIDLFKKTILMGVGIATMSKEKIEEWAKKVAEDGKLAKEEGKRFITDIVNQSDEALINMENKVREWVNSAINRLDIPSKSELDELRQRVDDLEKKLREEKKQAKK